MTKSYIAEGFCILLYIIFVAFVFKNIYLNMFQNT